jgi:hypothetical protein
VQLSRCHSERTEESAFSTFLSTTARVRPVAWEATLSCPHNTLLAFLPSLHHALFEPCRGISSACDRLRYSRSSGCHHLFFRGFNSASSLSISLVNPLVRIEQHIETLSSGSLLGRLVRLCTAVRHTDASSPLASPPIIALRLLPISDPSLSTSDPCPSKWPEIKEETHRKRHLCFA